MLILLLHQVVSGQQISYSSSNGHAHNDYRYNQPFTQAHAIGFGSIEVDLLLLHDTLFIGHDTTEALKGISFEKAYVETLMEAVRKNNGFVYPDTSKQLQLLIDLKTESGSTLMAVIKVLQKFPLLTANRSVKFVITGKQPPGNQFDRYPSFIFFDGNFSDPLHFSKHLPSIALFSANFRQYSKWNGVGKLNRKELITIRKLVRKSHDLHRPVRFWGAPDNPNTWRQLMKLKVDFINTDHIQEFANFIGTFR